MGERRGKGIGRREKREGKWNVGGRQVLVDAVISPPTYNSPSTADSLFDRPQWGSASSTRPSPGAWVKPVRLQPGSRSVPVSTQNQQLTSSSAAKAVANTVLRSTYRSNPRTQSFRSHQHGLFFQSPILSTYPPLLAL